MGTISIVIATYSPVAAGGHPIPRPPGVPGPQGDPLPGAATPVALDHAPVRPRQREAGDARMAQAVGPDHRPLSRRDGERRGLERGDAAGVGRRRVGARNEAITCCAQSDLGTTKCPTPGMITSLARLSGLAAACAACGEVMAS